MSWGGQQTAGGWVLLAAAWRWGLLQAAGGWRLASHAPARPRRHNTPGERAASAAGCRRPRVWLAAPSPQLLLKQLPAYELQPATPPAPSRRALTVKRAQ